MIFPSTSRKLPSTSLATNGNDATTSGIIVGAVPTTFCIISLVSGITITINIRNGTDLSRLITVFNADNTGLGSGSMPSFSPTTSRTPRGKPITSAKKVAITVT